MEETKDDWNCTQQSQAVDPAIYLSLWEVLQWYSNIMQLPSLLLTNNSHYSHSYRWPCLGTHKYITLYIFWFTQVTNGAIFLAWTVWQPDRVFFKDVFRSFKRCYWFCRLQILRQRAPEHYGPSVQNPSHLYFYTRIYKKQQRDLCSRIWAWPLAHWRPAIQQFG